MVKSPTFSVRCIRGLLAGCIAVASCADAAINLDKLSACDDIARLYEWMRAGRLASDGCASPRGVLERALAARLGPDASQLCFERSAPAPFLEGFSCVRVPVKVGAALECFRPAAAADIRVYKERHGESFAKPVSNYLAAASSCRVSNGDSSAAPWTTSPPLLSHIARFQFGFITGLGKERPPRSSAVHGYATTDPTIGGDAPSAIEFLYVITDAPKYSPTAQRKAAGNWVVMVDDDKAFEDHVNREARKGKAALMIDSMSYDLEYRGPGPVTHGAKLALIASLQGTIAGALEDEGFEAISESDLLAKTGNTGEALVQEIARNAPFGTRDTSPVKMAPTLRMLFNEKRPKCTNGGKGAIGVYLFGTQPVPDVRSDYGSIAIVVAGLGACSRSTPTSTRTYIDGLIDETTRQVLSTLERR